MKYLYIDTSSSYLYAAIVENDKLITKVCEDYGQSLSEIALPKIVSMFEKNNIKPTDINKIIVVNGPGSFTGIRIGITIAKVYAWSLKIKITTISSLEAMATSNDSNKVKVPIINARRGYVYGAIYDKNHEILKPQHIKFDELQLKLKNIDDYIFISNDKFENISNIEKYEPNFLEIVNKFKDKKEINPHMINPEYLKLTAAEESRI